MHRPTPGRTGPERDQKVDGRIRGIAIPLGRKMGQALRTRPIDVLARPARFERTTPAFGGQYSIQLSYGRHEHCRLRRRMPVSVAAMLPLSDTRAGSIPGFGVPVHSSRGGILGRTTISDRENDR